MKVSIGMRLQQGAFGGGNQFARVLADYLRDHGVTVVHDLADPDIDIILLGEPDRTLRISAYDHHDILNYLTLKNRRAIVIHRINNTSEARSDVEKTFNRFRIRANRVADHTIFVSQWVHDCYVQSGYQSSNYSVILNGADATLWTPRPLTPPQGKIKIVTHHWSTNPNKGFEIYQQLDQILDDPAWSERISFTFIGRVPQGICFKNTRYLEPLSGTALADQLRQHDIYLTASQHEAGPNHVLEGALCGLPLLYIESGAMPEYCAGYGVGFTPDNFTQKLAEMLETYPVWQGKVQHYPYTAERMCQQYLALFAQLLNDRDSILERRTARTHSIQDQAEWLDNLTGQVADFLESLHIPDQPARYLPARSGLTSHGEAVALGFSCFALKILHTLNRWESVSKPEKTAWLDFIRSFQVQGNPLWLAFGRNAFIDPPLLKQVSFQTSRRQRIMERLFHPKRLNRVQAMLSAETKQAIATLAQVGASATYPYRGFPTTLPAMQRYLESLDWSQPWAAGAHTATIAVFLKTEAPRFLSAEQKELLTNVVNRFMEQLADRETGAYFKGSTPGYDQLINGAMKVLTALDWLETPAHYPEKLIDTCLLQLPSAEGCHLVDAVYVLYRCQQQTDHRRAEIMAYCERALDMIREHHNPDGGFSYYVNRSQTHIHGVHITRGEPVSDIHGTVLLTWAVAMIKVMLNHNPDHWQVIRP